MESQQTATTCACKGVRACLLCCEAKRLPLIAVTDSTPSLLQSSAASLPTAHFCPVCQAVAATSEHGGVGHSDPVDGLGNLAGVRVFLDFVSSAEEAALAAEIDARPWVPSQSGRRKQDYGPKVNFKRRRLKPASFTGLPSYWSGLLPRLLALPGLESFSPVELCNLEYRPEFGAHIDPHVDDTWLWGERLVTLNLAGPSFLTLSPSGPAAGGVIVRIPMPRRSVLVLSGTARYDWLHAVLPGDVNGRRLAVTLRELAPDWLSTEEGRQLLEAGGQFAGVSVAEQAMTSPSQREVVEAS